MLVSKKELKANDVVIIKLITSEELIGKLVSYDGNKAEISKVFHLMIQAGPQGQPMPVLAPWAIGVDETKPMTIDSSKWIFIEPARTDVANDYTNATSPIKQAPKSGIIGV